MIINKDVIHMQRRCEISLKRGNSQKKIEYGKQTI